MINNLLYKLKCLKFDLLYNVGDSGVTVIMAASQAVDPGSTPGCRTEEHFSFPSYCGLFFQFSTFYLVVMTAFRAKFSEVLDIFYECSIK